MNTNRNNKGDFVAGNTYWKLRTKDGRNKLFETPEAFLNACQGYFNECDKNNEWTTQDFIKAGQLAKEKVDLMLYTPYTIRGLCQHLGITTQTFYTYKNDPIYADFSDTFTYVHEKVQDQQIKGATVGVFNANVVSRLNNLKDNVDVTSDGAKVEGIGAIVFKTAKEGE